MFSGEELTFGGRGDKDLVEEGAIFLDGGGMKNFLTGGGDSVSFENTVKVTLNGLCFIIWSSHKCNRLDCHESYIF